MKIWILVLCVIVAAQAHAGSLENLTDFGAVAAEELGIKHLEVKMTYDSPVYLAAHFSREIEGKVDRQFSAALKNPSAIIGITFLYRTMPIDPQGDEATHKFRVMLSGFEMRPDGKERETQRERLQLNEASEQISGRSFAIMKYLFKGSDPLPLNKRLPYFRLRDDKGANGKDVHYTVEFEVSEKPIEK